MKMESTRRSFDRSRELQQQLGLKKPRLANAEEPSLPSSNGRSYASRQAATLARLRAASDRDSESNSSSMSGGGGYQPQQPQLYQELMSQYKTALAELTFNSKPIITNLTIIAGENLHAAKAIAATICSNILEVPSEQKLPSLYLLDSIVKNIGRDYIKYFAARLPEVFCKAYRQVDSSVHQSMRHLFGTWKGVFPPQPLQMIGRELGFTPAVNGSSSGGTTSKPDSQPQRPPHSIHVNPKYLERQHLHQAKGVADDIIVPTASSTKDVERPDRAVTTGAGRTWVDPAVKIPNIQRSHREVLGEPVHEKKKIGAVYGDFEYGSDVVRTSGFGTGRTGGRVSEQGHDKHRLGAGSGVAETISGQRNGYNVKHGFSNYSGSKSNNVDIHPQPTQSTARRSSTGMSTSWKNSEEEEFMWEMHSRVSEQDVAIRSSESRKDHWPHDDSDKLELENILQKPSTSHAVGSTFDRDTSSESTEQKETSTFGHNLSSQWRSQGSPSNDFFAGMEGYSATAVGSLTNASSLPKVAVRPHTSSSHVETPGIESLANASLGSTHGTFGKQKFLAVGAVSPSEQSPKRQDSPSPPLPVLHPHQQLQSSAEQDYRQSKLLLRPDHRASQVSGKLLAQQHNLQKLLSDDPKPKVELSGLKPLIPPVSSVKTPTLGSSATDRSDLLSEETPGQSSTRSLLAAVMKSGILSNIASGGLPNQSKQDVSQIASQPSIQPSLSSRLPPTHFASSGPSITAVSSSLSLSDDISKTAADISQKEEGQPPLPPGLPSSSSQSPSSVSKDSNPLSNLLSTLVAKGLISASKSETPSTLPKQIANQSQTQKQDAATQSSSVISAVPLPSTCDGKSISKPDAKTSVALPEPEKVEINNLIGLEFKSEIIRELHPRVISALFDDLPHQCSLCGLKLKYKERLDRHLHWHALKFEGDGVSSATRRWYTDSRNWVNGETGVLSESGSSSLKDEFEEMIDEDEQMIPADEDQCVCMLCGELFEDYYSQRRNRWMFKEAVHMTILSQDGETETANESAKGPIVHANCVMDDSFHEATGVKVEKDA